MELKPAHCVPPALLRSQDFRECQVQANVLLAAQSKPDEYESRERETEDTQNEGRINIMTFFCFNATSSMLYVVSKEVFVQ